MSNVTQKLNWVIVHFGQDMNWWVKKVNDVIKWDVDGWSIIDPRQLAHIIELMDPLREYGLQLDIVEDAFFKFTVSDDLGNKQVRLNRVSDSLFETEENIFALPDSLDEEKGPYADFLDHITRVRVAMLNDLINLKHQLTIEEFEEEISEQQQNDLIEGSVTHVFQEITSILEYIPTGYEIDPEDEELTSIRNEEISDHDEFPDLDEEEKIEEDETMRWDEEESNNHENNLQEKPSKI